MSSLAFLALAGLAILAAIILVLLDLRRWLASILAAVEDEAS